MRGNMLSVFGGIVAAFFYVSLHLHMGIGQILWPLAAAPFYMVAISRPLSSAVADNLLALAGAGVLISLLSVAGALPGGSALKTLAGFTLLVALPAIVAGLYYNVLASSLAGDSERPRGEPILGLLILLALVAFFISSAAFAIMGKPLHTVFYDVAMPLADAMLAEFKTMNAPQAELSAGELARVISLQMAAFVPLVFVLIQGVCLLIARRVLELFGGVSVARIILSPLRFPLVISFLFFAALALYVFLLNRMPESIPVFYLGPVLVALALPLAVQGFGFIHENILKSLVNVFRYGVYMVLFITLMLAPVFLGMVFVLTGMLNQLYVSKTKIK